MTIIFGGAFRDCAVIGCDSLRVNLETEERFTIDKTEKISDAIAGARFGYSGPSADHLWDQIKSLDLGTRSDISLLLPKAAELGRPIYEERRSFFEACGKGDYGLTLMFASFDPSRGSGIHWIDFKMDQGMPGSRWRTEGAGVVAQGPDGSQQVATRAIEANLAGIAGTMNVNLDAWVFNCVAEATKLDPTTVGPPAYYRTVGIHGVSDPKLVMDPTIAGSQFAPL